MTRRTWILGGVVPLLLGCQTTADVPSVRPVSQHGQGLVAPFPVRDDVLPKAGCWSVESQAVTPVLPMGVDENAVPGAGPQGKQRLAPGFQGALPTNRWWSALAWTRPGQVRSRHGIYVHPAAMAVYDRGLTIGFMDRPLPVDILDRWPRPQGAVVYPMAALDLELDQDLTVRVDGLATPAVVERHSDWTVTMLWDSAGKSLRSTLVKGSPYTYFEAQGGDVVVDLGPPPHQVFHQKDGVLGLRVFGHSYGLFAPSGASWSLGPDGKSWRLGLGGKRHFAVALLPDPALATLEQFRRHAYAHVVGSRVQWSYDESHSEVRTKYELDTVLVDAGPGLEATPLVGLYPHQWKHLLGATPASVATYPSPRGTLHLTEGASFETSLPFHGVLPALPLTAGVDAGRLRGYLQEAVVPPASMVTDTYFGGKEIGKLVHLLGLAQQAGESSLEAGFERSLRGTLTQWFSTTDGDGIGYRYFADWQTLVGFPASFGSNTQLNDHHFHAGYMLQAAAAMALRDPAWAKDEAWGGIVKLIVRDATNPLRDDAEYPFLRAFDVFEGHSWASGHANFADGNNEESSSEAMNYFTGLILWGEATGNRTLRDLGIYLYATMASAIDEYWFDVDHQNFDLRYPWPMATQVWSGKYTYATWWTGQGEALHGINFLPFHGGSLYLGAHPGYLRKNYEGLRKFLGTEEGASKTGDAWANIIWNAQALYDPVEALGKFDQYAPQHWLGPGVRNPIFESGESLAHTYAWIASLNDLGLVDTGVTADVALHAVFQKAGQRTRMAFHAGCVGDRTVQFSDGTSMVLPPRTMGIQADGQTVRLVPMGYATACSAPALPCP